MDAVSEVLIARAERRWAELDARARRPSAHVVLVAVVRVRAGVVVRRGDKRARDDHADQPRRPGRPDDGGMTTLGGRPIQQAVRSKPKKPIEPVRPPAAKAPEMIEPTKAPPKKTDAEQGRRPRIRGAARRPRARRLQKGTRVAETGAQGPGLRAVVRRRRHRRLSRRRELLLPRVPRDDGRPDQARTGISQQAPRHDAGEVRHPDATGASPTSRSSNRAASRRSILRAPRAAADAKLPPLPPAYPEPALTVHLYFDYTR